MAMSIKFWFRWAVVALVAGAVAYTGLMFRRQDAVKLQLNQLLQQAIEEKEQLQSTISAMEYQIREREARLNELSDVQSIRQSLTQAQATIENINQELERVNRERIALQNSSLSSTSRLQNTTKEYMKALDDLKKAREEAARLAKEQSPDKRKIDESSRQLQAKTDELAKVKADFAKQQKSYDELVAANKDLEKRVKTLESEKASLADRMRQLDIDVEKQGSPLKAMRDTVEELKTQLSRKESQVKALQSELVKADEEAAVLRSRVGRAASQQVSSQDAQLKAQLSELIGQLNAAREEMAALKKAPGTSGSAEQDRKLSDILVKKEIELESTRRKARDAEDKIMSLESQIRNLENTLAVRQQTQERIRELESERLALESKLLDAQGALGKKSELSQNLQQNVDYLNQQLALRDKEKADLQAKLAGLDSVTKQDLEKERSRYAEVNTLYNSLKTQIAQFSQALDAKTAELDQRNKDVYSLREELTGLKSKVMIMENELTEARDRQRKTLDDLIAAVRLNSILQDRIAGGASVPYADLDDKQRAEELRKKIEVILVPPNKQ